LGISEDVIENNFDRGEYEKRIAIDVANARSLGVNSTPTFFVGGRRLNASDLLGAIDQEVAALN